MLAEELERLSDPRLGFVTLTGVEVSRDLAAPTSTTRRSAPTTDADRDGSSTRSRSASPHLRAVLGRQVRLKYVPELRFQEDPGGRPGPADRGDHPAPSASGAVDDADERRSHRDHAARASTTPWSGPRRRSTRAEQSSRSRATSAPTATRSARCSALHHVLRAAGHGQRRVVPEAVRRRAALPRAARASTCSRTPDEFPTEPDVMVTFDCGSLARLGDLARRRKAAARAHRHRPPRLERALRHDQRHRSRRRGERRASCAG